MLQRFLTLVCICTFVFLASCGLITIGTLNTSPGISGTGLNLVAGSESDYQHQGGQQFVLLAACASGDTTCTLTTLRLTQTLKILIVRLNVSANHISDAYMKTQPSANNSAVRITVQVPGKHDVTSITDLLTQPGVIQFLDTKTAPLAFGTQVKPGSYPILFTNADLDQSAVGIVNDSEGHPQVTFEMRGGAARDRFATYTQQNVGNYLTIALDNVVLESAVIQSEIAGQGEISGSLTESDAQRIATLLKTEPLPLAVQVSS